MTLGFISIMNLVFCLTFAILSHTKGDPNSTVIYGNQPNQLSIENIYCTMESGKTSNIIVQKRNNRLPRGTGFEDRKFGVRGDRFIRLGRRGTFKENTIQGKAECTCSIGIPSQQLITIKCSQFGLRTLRSMGYKIGGKFECICIDPLEDEVVGYIMKVKKYEN